MKTPLKPKHKILVVDDDPDLNKAFTLMLEFDGHEVQSVDGGLAALATLERRQFDVIITDYFMPGLKGDQLAALVKQRWPTQPIIMMSGSFGNRIEEGGLASGVDCLLNKPFTLEELREAILWVLERHAEGRQGGSLPAGSMAATLPPPESAGGSAEARRGH